MSQQTEVRTKYDPLDELDIDELVDRLTPGEIQKFLDECDPDDSSMPPSMRTNYKCNKKPTGPLNRQKLLDFINEQALNTPDIPDSVPYVPNTIRGKKWIPPQRAKQDFDDDDIELDIELGDEYEIILNSASTDEVIDLAGILGLHSMMNQDQYHSAQSDKWAEKADPKLGWNGNTKATPLKVFPEEAPNTTNPTDVIKSLQEEDTDLTSVNLNNVPVSDSQFIEIFNALKENDTLNELSLANTTLGDFATSSLIGSLKENKCLEKLNVESNNISPATLTKIFEVINDQQIIKEIKASNQKAQFLGNKVEMAITKSIESNKAILKVGLHFEFGDCRNRVAVQLQKNLDRIRLKRVAEKIRKQSEIKPISSGSKTGGYLGGLPGQLSSLPNQRLREEDEDEYEYYTESDEEEQVR